MVTKLQKLPHISTNLFPFTILVYILQFVSPYSFLHPFAFVFYRENPHSNPTKGPGRDSYVLNHHLLKRNSNSRFQFQQMLRLLLRLTIYANCD
ncbi:hypothetical protein CDL12_02795 [Handroanthus impetiginosus]|uniref:Uncharacterized protein n=1 Tax=Handroanthus impetiginosus TaxID=429701 RepID=A0A2G9I3W9_9LAMI|nr:hypothetical protein CDL12_02795 [Handroanthus impetiginosus]